MVRMLGDGGGWWELVCVSPNSLLDRGRPVLRPEGLIATLLRLETELRVHIRKLVSLESGGGGVGYGGGGDALGHAPKLGLGVGSGSGIRRGCWLGLG